jgi:Penicillinase repressor
MTSFLLPADELEYAVLAKLWELGAASVRELHEQLGEPAGRVYTTTAKVIDRPRGKGLIQRQRLLTLALAMGLGVACGKRVIRPLLALSS